MSHVLPPAEYYAARPRNIAGAGCLFRDSAPGEPRILLVKPTYHDDGTWELPGGGLDEGESPWDAAAREAEEELALRISPGRLVAVDWVPTTTDGRPPLANFLFDCGILPAAEAKQRIRLQADELSAWRFAGPGDWDRLLRPHMARRVRACAAALADGSTFYLQQGRPPAAR